jgi:hypothetical protein
MDDEEIARRKPLQCLEHNRRAEFGVTWIDPLCGDAASGPGARMRAIAVFQENEPFLA